MKDIFWKKLLAKTKRENKTIGCLKGKCRHADTGFMCSEDLRYIHGKKRKDKDKGSFFSSAFTLSSTIWVLVTVTRRKSEL